MNDPIHLGPFTVGDQIGEGGMGAVYRGTHRETGVPVALKVIRHAAEGRVRRQFEREVQAHAGLQHPGIVYLFEYGDIGEVAGVESDGPFREGSPYVAMELAELGTLRDVMPLTSWQLVSECLVQILDALAHAHARDVIHRDLKPENFLLFDADPSADHPWRIKLADFGVAHAFDQEQYFSTDDLESAAGTPWYMTPEQFRGHWRSYGPWTDLYAVGCIAWELICGRPPFESDDIVDLAIKHENERRPAFDPQFPIPDELESWVHRAMTPDPAHRFRRAADALWTLPRGDLTDVDSARDLDDSGRVERDRGHPLTVEDVVANLADAPDGG
ncbi:MAG: serine/threonine-protein kinase, partial [Bradymonadaceae bacterium]